MKTPSACMNVYINALKAEGYTSLKDKYYSDLAASFPALNNSPTSDTPLDTIINNSDDLDDIEDNT